MQRKALRREAAEKLSNWRRKAVLDILDCKDDVQPESVALAQFLLDQHFTNVYLKLNTAAIRFTSLLWILIPTVVGLFGLSFILDSSRSASFLYDPEKLALVILAGAIGALVSSTLSQLGVGGRIPDFLHSIAGWSVRPFIGALSAVIVCIVVESDLLPLEAATDLSLYAWAVTAGFSDQLVSFVMRRVEESAEQ